MGMPSIIAYWSTLGAVTTYLSVGAIVAAVKKHNYLKEQFDEAMIEIYLATVSKFAETMMNGMKEYPRNYTLENLQMVEKTFNAIKLKPTASKLIQTSN